MASVLSSCSSVDGACESALPLDHDALVIMYAEVLSHAFNSAQELIVEFSERNMSFNEADWYRLHRRLVRPGQVILLLGALVLVTHWLTHVDTFGPWQSPGWTELVAGYTIGAFLLVAGAILPGGRQA